MARKNTQEVSLDFAFFEYLHQFYKENRPRIRKHYKDLTKKYLDFNDPTNTSSFLRQPQFEALEMYIFLKEYLDNEHVYKIFKDWAEASDRFAGRTQLALFESVNKEQYDRIFERMQQSLRRYGRIVPC